VCVVVRFGFVVFVGFAFRLVVGCVAFGVLVVRGSGRGVRVLARVLVRVLVGVSFFRRRVSVFRSLDSRLLRGLLLACMVVLVQRLFFLAGL